MITIPLSLRNAFETQNCVLFIGAGIGYNCKKPNGDFAPDANILTSLLANKFSIDLTPKSSLMQVSEIVELRHGRKELEAFINSQLSDLTPDDYVKWITSIRWKAIFTTNYDNNIERAYDLSSKPVQMPVSYSITSDIKTYAPGLSVPIYHIHGHFSGKKNPNIIITKTDYTRFREKRRMLFESFKRELVSSTIIYLGYSNSDPNWETLLEETLQDIFPETLPISYRIDPFADPLDVEILQSKNIFTLQCNLNEFVDSVSPITTNINTSIESFSIKDVPPDLHSEYYASRIPMSRLLYSWEYLNQSIAKSKSNLKNFLQGDSATWALIEREEYFERDIQQEVYDSLLDFATGSRMQPLLNIILAPGGYGISTLLKILAVKLVKDNAGAVFVLRPGASIIEGDIEYASKLFPNTFFFIDNAADFSTELDRSVQLLQNLNQRSMFLLGDHLNEWHQKLNRPRGREFLLEPLSDNEIDKLLDFLTKNNVLNKLEDFPRDVQFSIIKQKYEKDLLVVMRESIENSNFDAIIEHEYRGIGDELSKLYYLYVCFFFQHGALLRDELIAQLMETNLPDLYRSVNVYIEGIVSYECIDNIRQLFAARARHHKIAAVVWERCGDSAAKETIIMKTIKLLNLNYSVDAKAFEYFIKSDRIVDSLRRLEDRTNFFESCIRKDPTSSYVLQHYARMLARTGNTKIALTQIDDAIRKDPSIRVLYHTKGKILSELAITEDSIEIGRKYLVQAEISFQKGINFNSRDSYCFESLADLYYNWARKVKPKDITECTDYLRKAQEIISQGLRTVTNRESLWILSSKIQFYLGNTPESLQILETAISEHSGAVISRLMLARIYRQNGDSSKAKSILEIAIKNNQDEFLIFIEYALALLDLGESYKKAASALEISSLYGLSDPTYIATLGGLQFLDKDFSHADKTFQEAIKHYIPVDELHKIRFRPTALSDRAIPLMVTGKITGVYSGYSFIQTSEYPPIICPASKYGGVVLRKDMEVSITLAFSAKSPVGLYPTTL